MNPRNTVLLCACPDWRPPDEPGGSADALEASLLNAPSDNVLADALHDYYHDGGIPAWACRARVRHLRAAGRDAAGILRAIRRISGRPADWWSVWPEIWLPRMAGMGEVEVLVITPGRGSPVVISTALDGDNRLTATVSVGWRWVCKRR